MVREWSFGGWFADWLRNHGIIEPNELITDAQRILFEIPMDDLDFVESILDAEKEFNVNIGDNEWHRLDQVTVGEFVNVVTKAVLENKPRVKLFPIYDEVIPETYTKEKVKQLCTDAFYHGVGNAEYKEDPPQEIEKWLAHNLK